METQLAENPENRTTTRRRLLGSLKGQRRHGVWFFILLGAPLVVGGCTTTKRDVDLVVDHHVGMARGAIDIMSGEAEAREQRVAKLRADLEASQTALAAEQDQGRLIELLKQHVALQDALIADLLQGHGHHHTGPQQAATDSSKRQAQSDEH